MSLKSLGALGSLGSLESLNSLKSLETLETLGSLSSFIIHYSPSANASAYSRILKSAAKVLHFLHICKSFKVFAKLIAQAEWVLCNVEWVGCVFLKKFIHKKYIYFSIYSIKHENAFFCVLSYGYPMGMLWLSYGNGCWC